MLNRLSLAQFPPASQLLILTGLTLILWFLLTSVGMLAAHALLGVDAFTDASVLSDYSNPDSLKAIKLIQFFSALGMFVLPPLALAALVGPNVLRWLSLVRKPTARQAFIAMLLIVAGLPIINAMASLNDMVVLPQWLEPLEVWMRSQEESMAGLTKGLLRMDTPVDLATNLLIIAVIPAIGEELLFRGAVQRLFLRMFRNPHVAIWVTGALFSFIHFQFYGFLPRMVLGAMLGYLVYWTGSLWPAIIAHFTNNAFAILLAYLVQQSDIDPQVEEVGASSGDWIFLVASVFIVAGLIMTLIRARNNSYTDEVLANDDPPGPVNPIDWPQSNN